MGNISNSSESSLSDNILRRSGDIPRTLSDIDIISQLCELGPQYIDTGYKQYDAPLYYNLINSYHTLYITDNDIFEDGTNRYIQYIIDNDTDIWERYVNMVDNVDKSLNMLLQKTYHIEIDAKFIFYTKLFRPLEIKKRFIDNDMWNHPFFINIIVSIELNNNWNDNITSMYKLIRKILLYKPNRNSFIVWLSKILNKNIRRMNCHPARKDFLLILKQTYNDNFMINIMSIIYKFWEVGATKDTMKKINYEYVLDKKCPIKWYNIKNNNTNKHSFLTKCFFLMLQSLRVYYIPMIHRLSDWKHEMEAIKNIINELDTSDIYDKIEYIIYNNTLNKSTSIYDNNKKLLQNELIAGWVDEFYKSVINWIKICKITTQKICLDDILQDIYYYNNYNDFQHKTFNIAINVLDSNKLTLNNDIKHKYMESITQININNVNTHKLKKIIYGIIKLCISMSKYEGVMGITKRYSTYSLMDMLYKNKNISYCVVDYFNNSNNTLIKYLHGLLNDISILNNELTREIDTYDISEKKTIYEVYTECVVHLEHLMQVPRVLHVITSDRMILKTINTLSGCLTNMIDIENMLNTNSALVISTIKIYYTVINKNNISLDINPTVLDYIKKWIIENNIKASIREYDNYRKSISIIQALNIIKKSLCKKQVVYPEKILDPITCTPMNDPILLPDMEEYKSNFFMDRKVIYNILMNKEENPYTKNKLTIKDVEEYNKRDDIIKKIKEFKNKYGIK